MTSTMDSPRSARWRRRAQALAGNAAEAAGGALRNVGRGAPGVAGPLAVSSGLWLAWRPLGLIALGVFLLLLDRRMP